MRILTVDALIALIDLVAGRHRRLLLFVLVQSIDHDGHDSFVHAQRTHQVRMLIEDSIVHDVARATMQHRDTPAVNVDELTSDSRS